MTDRNLVFSGYVRCKYCKEAKKTFQVGGGCNKCNRRDFDYGVLHHGQFIPYKQLKERVKRGCTFVDGTHQGLLITSKTFGLRDVVRKKRQSSK